MIARPPSLHASRKESFALGCRITLALALNVVLWWIGYEALDGSAMLSEIYEAEPHVRRLYGDEVLVSPWAHHYSFWHSLSVLLTFPGLVVCAVMLFVDWVRLR